MISHAFLRPVRYGTFDRFPLADISTTRSSSSSPRWATFCHRPLIRLHRYVSIRLMPHPNWFALLIFCQIMGCSVACTPVTTPWMANTAGRSKPTSGGCNCRPKQRLVFHSLVRLSHAIKRHGFPILTGIAASTSVAASVGFPSLCTGRNSCRSVFVKMRRTRLKTLHSSRSFQNNIVFRTVSSVPCPAIGGARHATRRFLSTTVAKATKTSHRDGALSHTG